MAALEEDVIDPGLEIVDPHHHLWDHHAPPYVLDDLLADTAGGHRVTRTVYIECGWKADPSAYPPRFAPVTEVEHLVGLAAESQRRDGAVIAKVVGHADLRYGDSISDVLDRLAEVGQGKLAGIRQCVNWDASDEVSTHPSQPAPHLLTDPTFQRGFRHLVGRGLAFDVWMYHPQLPDLVALARKYQEVPIVLDHFGGPLALGPYAGHRAEVRQQWQHSMSQLRDCENVVVKLGGIGMPALAGPPAAGQSWSSADLAREWGPDLRWCIEQFGADRCMFESNFPVDRRRYAYGLLWNAFKRIAADATPTEQVALFRGTAQRVYSLSAINAIEGS